MDSPSNPLTHPITAQSFALIDREFGEHGLTPDQYAVVRRVIHSTADFEFKHLVRFSQTAIESGIAALQQGAPVIVDVGMVQQGVRNLLRQTFDNPLLNCLEQVPAPAPEQTRTEAGLLHWATTYPQGIFVIGNAPTALLALCQQLQAANVSPALVIGAPVGFVSVLEAKAALSACSVPQIQVEGRKGGSPVAAAILNALIILAWEREV
ncbi:precorrin-8X methylmutase [Leptolyngbya sp. FACHB-261]|uniref:precorrin-8X methylmutase n=1 Tax=Leptolyngbya sp. FACHB-261 TaxID=2692806 RepID=UPI0016881D11|nr:precorrin-8X methylmutase [Leptolyngbya sp. FACHB-261]MBD2104989.1 precorrin-8X methylmutase [Leptolyngbya sp. FACHB-261]